MNRCPISYQECDNKYSLRGLKKLSNRLTALQDFPYSAEEQRIEAASRASKMSIQGIQPKLSAVLNIKDSTFEIVDANGQFIIKPQHYTFKELPQNEDLTMRLAGIVEIAVPLHGMIYSKDGTLSYFIKRFDRTGREKFPLEDFAQLSGKTRDTKYDSSMENVMSVIEKYCSFPQIEKEKLFRLTVFNFLTGNEDMHLKNFSLLTKDDLVALSPAYDLINTTIALGEAKEEIALPIKGKKNNLKKSDLIDYFAKNLMQLTEKTIDTALDAFFSAESKFTDLINKSFLSGEAKDKYHALFKKRLSVLK